jgi:hypothetical protein
MRISYTPLGVIPTQPVLALSVAYHGFYRQASLTQDLVSTKCIGTSMGFLAWHDHRRAAYLTMTTIALVYPYTGLPIVLLNPVSGLAFYYHAGCRKNERLLRLHGSPTHWLSRLFCPTHPAYSPSPWLYRSSLGNTGCIPCSDLLFVGLPYAPWFVKEAHTAALDPT